MFNKKVIIIVIVSLIIFFGILIYLADEVKKNNELIIKANLEKLDKAVVELERMGKRKELKEEKETAYTEIKNKENEDIEKYGEITRETRKELVETANEFYKKEKDLLSEKEKEEMEKDKLERERLVDEAKKKMNK